MAKELKARFFASLRMTARACFCLSPIFSRLASLSAGRVAKPQVAIEGTDRNLDRLAPGMEPPLFRHSL
jgi:hypothetical protein